MTVLIDMDDVIERLALAWVEYVNEKYGTCVSIDDVHDWDMSLAFPGLTREQVYGAELDDALWDRVKPMPGADCAMRKLLGDGHEIYIVTSTLYPTLKAKMDRVLFRYFPYIPWEHVIITSHKQMVKGDVLVDDNPRNLEGGDYRKILFTAHHNKTFDEKTIGAIRVNNWEEAYGEICKIAEKIKKQ